MRASADSPSTRIGLEVKNGFKERLAYLLIRHCVANACPLTELEFADVWNELQNPEVVRAIRTLRAHNLRTNIYPGRNVRMTVGPWTMNIYHASGHEWHPDDKSPFITTSGDKKEVATAWLTGVLGVDRDAALYHWMRECKARKELMFAARRSFDEVLNMCTTVGQLHRIVPESLTFVNESKVDAHAKQVKASPYPSGYFNLDHAALEKARNHIATCQLLPPIPKGFSNKIDHYTWAYSSEK